MRLNRLHLALSVLIFSLLLASPAFANSVTMTYEGHGAGNNTSYPWLFSINGSGQPYTTLICDAYDNVNAVGETWQATATPLLQAIGLFGLGGWVGFEDGGVVFYKIVAGAPGGGAWG